jgi:hypothetical protein
MSEQPDYTAVSLTAVTLREAVSRRPGMYFGAFEPVDWPLVIMAWTILDLVDLAPAQDSHAAVRMLPDGVFDVSVQHGTLPCPARASTAADALRLRQWWTQLCRDVTITVGRRGPAVDVASVPADDHGHRMLVDVDIAVVASVDPHVVPAPSASWWPGWLDRLPDVLRRLGFEFGPAQQIVAADVASDTRRVLAA